MSDSQRAIPLPPSWTPGSEVRCTTKDRSPSALAAYNHDELTRFLGRASDCTSAALLEAAALCDRELGAVPIDTSERERCRGCARCLHRKRQTARARRGARHG